VTDDPEFGDFDGLDAGAPSGAAKPGHDDHGRSAAGPWFVRFAGRRTGPVCGYWHSAVRSRASTH
jgi:hypothetical protein